MYQNDAEVERDVAALRRKLKEEPVEQQVAIRRHSTNKLVWWVVSSTASRYTRHVWFYLERSKGSDKGVHVKDPKQNMAVLATLPTVEAAYFAGAIVIERPS